MGGTKRLTDLLDEPLKYVWIEARPSDSLVQAATTEIPHHEIRASRFPPEVIKRHDVRVLEAGHGLSLKLKPPNEIGIVGELGSDDLYCHRPV